MSHDTDSFNAGYLLAVANIMHLHDEETVATDVLRELGIEASAVKTLGLTNYDASPLRKLFKNIRRR